MKKVINEEDLNPLTGVFKKCHYAPRVIWLSTI